MSFLDSLKSFIAGVTGVTGDTGLIVGGPGKVIIKPKKGFFAKLKKLKKKAWGK